MKRKRSFNPASSWLFQIQILSSNPALSNLSCFLLSFLLLPPLRKLGLLPLVLTHTHTHTPHTHTHTYVHASHTHTVCTRLTVLAVSCFFFYWTNCIPHLYINTPHLLFFPSSNESTFFCFEWQMICNVVPISAASEVIEWKCSSNWK